MTLWRQTPRLAGYETEQVLPLYQRVLETLARCPGALRGRHGRSRSDANTDDTGNISIAGYNDREGRQTLQVECRR